MIPPKPLMQIPLVPQNTLMRKVFCPFEVNPSLFDLSMSCDFVFIFVAVYVTVVFLLNQFNASRQYKPWGLSKTPTFKAIVILHNALLALFSAWALCGMIYTHYNHWHLATTGLESSFVSNVIEYFCQMDSEGFRSEF